MKFMKWFNTIVFVLAVALIGYGLYTDCPDTAGYVKCLK